MTVNIRYYVEVLGFMPDWGADERSDMASVSRDGRAIMLTS